MNSIDCIQKAFDNHIKALFSGHELSQDLSQLHINVDESKQAFGNLSTSVALVLAKTLKRIPREVATEIATSFTHPLIEKIEVAGPGFINLYFKPQLFKLLACELYEQKDEFFRPDELEKKYNISLEFVSANPTGPLHFGHGRGGIIGDVLGNVLRFVGHNVTKEFYINDAGNQIQKLGESFKVRCLQAAGMDATVPEDGYHGQYLADLAHDCYAEMGQKLFDEPDSFFADYAKNNLLQAIKNTLTDYGIEYDVWFSEKSLHANDAIPKALKILQHNGLLFEHDGALWFRTTQFGDDKDRVVQKSTGEYTYIAADIAYLQNKIDRGADNLMMVLGHDHHSYVMRLNAVKNGLGYEDLPLSVILYQLVKISEGGALVRMSKRAGAIVGLQDIIDTVGKDVARFFYLNRKADAQLEFDLDLALKKTEENPVYYVQYAYVRTGSILVKASQHSFLENITAADAQHIGQEEAFLLKKIVFLEQLLMDITINHQTHLLTYYVLELAQLFHRYYSHVRVIDVDNIEKSRARLLMIGLLRNTIALVLDILGISHPEKM
ncbi:MAG TPA: arginine--tRNA ligase, partial [Candidatus Babeliales bacterium]|jgi:arginyl-tRNA synthetase|nr:arginine--tRNA ligase [Candidatus Babeliales bacterium]